MDAVKAKPRILVVGEAASVHTARFFMMARSTGYDFRLFSNAPNSYQDGLLRDAIVYCQIFTSVPHNGNTLILAWPIPIAFRNPLMRAIGYWQRITRYFYKRSRAKYALRRTINSWKPDLIISLKMQDDGYVCDEAFNIMPSFPRWLHFSWGTDIEYFGRSPEQRHIHLPQITSLLSHCHYHIADTLRDIEAAEALGFKGHSLGRQVAQGGFELPDFVVPRARPHYARKVILVKGRQGGYIGQGMRIIEALHKLRDELREYEIKVILATPNVVEKCREYSETDGRLYECCKFADHNDLMDLFSQARITISATDVDGTPGFLLESMVTGALPIHSRMASIEEWIENGTNGLLFDVNDHMALKAAILRGVTDAPLFERARTRNWELMQQHADKKAICQSTKTIIDSILAAGQS